MPTSEWVEPSLKGKDPFPRYVAIEVFGETDISSSYVQGTKSDDDIKHADARVGIAQHAVASKSTHSASRLTNEPNTPHPNMSTHSSLEGQL
eukprot:6049700-Amphidinium_carterae.1